MKYLEHCGILNGETNFKFPSLLQNCGWYFCVPASLVIWSCTHSQTLTPISAEMKLNLVVFMIFSRYGAWLTMKPCTRSQVFMRQRERERSEVRQTHCDCPLSPGVSWCPSTDRLRSLLCFLWFFSMTRQLILSVSSFLSINHGKTMESVETSLFTSTTTTTNSIITGLTLALWRMQFYPWQTDRVIVV